MTDRMFFQEAEEMCDEEGYTLLEYNAEQYVVLCYCTRWDDLYLFSYDSYQDDWYCIRCVGNTNEGFQYMMDLYQLIITRSFEYKKR